MGCRRRTRTRSTPTSRAQGGARRRQHLVGEPQGEGGGAQAELDEDRGGHVQERRHGRDAGGRDGGAQEGGEEGGREEVRRRLMYGVLVLSCGVRDLYRL